MILGVDIGDTFVKAVPIDVHDGQVVGEHEWCPTPSPATPAAVVAALGELADRFSWDGPIGITHPGVVVNGIVRTAGNLHRSWIGTDLAAFVERELGQPVTVINRADAAALAEVHCGAGRGHDGVIVTVTLGPDVRTGLTVDGVLVPNTEFGHLQQGGSHMEDRVAARAPAAGSETWEAWGREVDTYLHALENMLWPSLFIICGDISADFDRFDTHLRLRTPVVASARGIDAGIIGAALAHHFRLHRVAPTLPRR